jgi:hypothetical protein
MTNFNLSGHNLELLIAFVALVISFISIFLTFWTIRIQKIHNKLSVRPFPEIILSKVGGVKIRLKNVGLGPMICKELTTKNEDGQIKNHIKDFIPPELSFEGKLYTNRWNFTLLPGESKTILSIKEDLSNSSYRESLKIATEALSQLTLELKFESMYKELQPIFKKKLIWFKTQVQN